MGPELQIYGLLQTARKLLEEEKQRHSENPKFSAGENRKFTRTNLYPFLVKA